MATRSGTKANQFQEGSALIVTVMMIAVLCLIAGTLLSFTSSKQSGPFQAASWHEAGAAAEGGVEIALNALRRKLNEGNTAWDGWTADPDVTTATKYITNSQLLIHDGEGNGETGFVRAVIDVSKPTGNGTINPVGIANNRYAYLIRATGYAAVPGPSRLAVDKADLNLRKINVFRDMRVTNANSAITTPQVSRVVEAIAAPVTPFPAAILAKEIIEIKGGSNMKVDSYDPTVSPYKYDTTVTDLLVGSTGGRRANGNIATNAKKKHDTDEVIRLENAKIWGIAAKGKGAVTVKNDPIAHVYGQVIDGFYRELKPVQDPSKNSGFRAPTVIDWTLTNTLQQSTDRPTGHHQPGTITITCGKSAAGNNPAQTSYYKIKKLHLHSNEVLKIVKNTSPSSNNPNDPSLWGTAEIWITDDVVIHNGGQIEVDDGARAVIYFGRNLTLQEKDSNHFAVDNRTQLKTFNATNPTSTFVDPSALQFYGAVPDHHKKQVKIKTDMAGVIYAPDHDFEVNPKAGNPQRQFYGALTGRKFEIKGASQIHYDESLSDIGKPLDYTLESWQEDWYDPAVRKTAP